MQGALASRDGTSTLAQPAILGSVILTLCWHPKQDHSQMLLVPCIICTLEICLSVRRVNIFQRALTMPPICCKFHKNDRARLHLVRAYFYLNGRKRVKIGTLEFEFMGTH